LQVFSSSSLEGALNTLGIFFLQQNLHAPLALYGFLSTALGAGLTLGAFLAGIFAQRLGVTRVLSVGLTLSEIAAIAYARLTNFSLALVVTFLIGFLSGGINVAVGPILYHTTPRAFIGRVAAVVTPALALSSLFSVALVSYLDSTPLHNFQTSLLGIHFGPIDTIFLGAGVLATLGGVYAMINLRGLTIADTTESVADNEEILAK
jgi:MFS family permease